MNYQILTPSEKALLKPLLARKLGTSPGKDFLIGIRGLNGTHYRCSKLQFSWTREVIDVSFWNVDIRFSPYYTLTIPFMQPIEKDFVLPETTALGRTKTHHHRVADRVLLKDKPRPRNVNEIIALLKDTDAYEILREDKLSRRDIDVTTRTIANIIGMLEIMQREQQDG